MFGICMVLMMAGGAIGATYNDNTINFPGYDYLGYTADQIGIPTVNSMTVNVDPATNRLLSVIINVTDRNAVVDYYYADPDITYDALFISTGGAEMSWDYYVEDQTGSNADGATFYTLGGLFAYKYATQPWGTLSGRWGHPSGINVSANTSGVAASVISASNTLTYDFANFNIILGPDFQIGYAEWCANDVILTPYGVSEPMSLILLGLGLVGVAGYRRKFKS